MSTKSFKSPSISIYAMAVCGLFTALITIGAFVKIPFPVVPLTLQTLFVVLAALILGAKYSSISVGLYLFLGLAGLPIFTKGGGLGYVFQPSFGYLLGFLVATFVMGTLSNKINLSSSHARGKYGETTKKHSLILWYWLVGMIGTAVVYIIGMSYLYFLMKFYMKTPIGFLSLFTVNFLLTIAGDVFKCFVAALLAARLLPVLRKSAQFLGLNE